MPLVFISFLSSGNNTFGSVDSQEDFSYLVTWVGFVLICKAVKHMRGEYTTLSLLLSDVPLFHLSVLLELDLSCRMEGKHLDLDSNFVVSHWSLYCCGLISKLHAVSTGGIVWMSLNVYCCLAKIFSYHLENLWQKFPFWTAFCMARLPICFQIQSRKVSTVIMIWLANSYFQFFLHEQE